MRRETLEHIVTTEKINGRRYKKKAERQHCSVLDHTIDK